MGSRTGEEIDRIWLGSIMVRSPTIGSKGEKKEIIT